MHKNSTREKGQSLIEVLIYTAIFGAVAASLMTIVWGITKIHSNTMANNEVESNLRYAMNLISNQIRSASSVESATESTLVLKMPNNATSTFTANAGVLYLQEGSSDPVAVISDRVAVSKLVFEKIDMVGAKGGARVTMTLNYVPKEGGPSNLKKTLISALTRSATAISFSEDIVPGQDNSYSVGSASYNWKNGYFSGDVTVDGTISGTTFCISSDCKTAWPSGGGGTVTGSGTTNKIAKWTSSTALGDSIIVDNGTNVGVGETNPASGAVFSVVGNATFAGVSGAWNGGNPYLRFSHDSTTSYIDQNSSGRNIHIRAKNSGGSLGDQLFLEEGGNIGIGTTDPVSKLNLFASGAATRLTFSNPGNRDSYIESDSDQGSGAGYFFDFNAAYSGTIMRFFVKSADGISSESLRMSKASGASPISSFTGSVGIGAVSPGAALEVSAGADELLRLTRTTASYPTKFKVGTDSAFVINSGNSDVLAIKSGKVGIGLTSPTSTLTVAGTVESTTGGFKFPDGTTQTTAASGSSAWTTSGNDIYNSNSGNVGIGASPQAGMRLDIRSVAATDGSSAITAYGYNGNGGMAIKGYGYATTGTGNNTGITGISTGSRASGTNIGGYFNASGAAANYALITGSGNVGIGTSTPGYKLDVSGDVNYSGALREDGVEIFSGMIAMFDTACPTGWTRFTALDGRFVRGAATYGTTGGSDTHSHGISTYTTASGNQSANHNHSYDDTTGNASVGHTHDVSGTTGTDNPNHYHSYLKPSSGTSMNTAGVTASHTHSFSDTSSNQSVTHTHSFSGTTAGVSVDHSHNYTKSPGDTDSGSTLPAYLEIVVCKKNAGADVAEWTLSREKYEPATLVSLDSSAAKTVKASDKAYDSAIAGIVSTEPGWILGRETSQKTLLAISGQVPLKVSTMNGLIKIGDSITSSEIAGFGMKAIDAGSVVAKAMEDFDPNKISQIIPCPKGSPADVTCGEIMVLVNISWHNRGSSQTLIDSLVEKVKSILASIGIWAENQIIKVKELVAEKIFSHKIRVEQLEMIDKQTNELYCTWIENGEWEKSKGECE